MKIALEMGAFTEEENELQDGIFLLEEKTSRKHAGLTSLS